MTPSIRRVVPIVAGLAVVLAGGALLFGAGGTSALGGVLSPGPADDRVAFRETAIACGVEYRTTGSAAGSDDGGVFVADYDRDGYPDLLAVGGERPVLFRNTGAGFERSGALPSMDYPPMKSALFFDGDGDGWRDLLLVPRTGQPVYLSNRNGTYRRTAGFGVDLQWGTGASAADFDLDGDLDVFLVQNGDWLNQTPRRGVRGGATDGYPNLLFENAASGFERVTDAGIRGTRWSLATSFVDLTRDGYPDIHVANDYGRDAVYVNRGNGTFDRRLVPGTNRHGMASVVRDVTGDGRLDVFVTNIEFENPETIWAFTNGLGVRNRGNTLLINRGNGTFRDRAAAYGVRRGGWGWAAAVTDFDNDGLLDVLHATKYYLERTTSGGFSTVRTTPSLWEGMPGGNFSRRNASTAGFVPSNGRGLATLDFDRDGDLDVAIADTSGRFKLYENADAGGNWLQIRVEGGSRPALGTRVTVVTGDERITRVVQSRSNFFSQSTRVLHVGLGDARVRRVRVVRPDGTTRVFRDVGTNRRVAVTANGALRRRGRGAREC